MIDLNQLKKRKCRTRSPARIISPICIICIGEAQTTFCATVDALGCNSHLFGESNIYIYCVLLCVITVNYYIFVGEAQTTLCASVTYGISELLRKIYISTSAICACQHFGKSQKKHGSACSSTSHPSLFVIVDHPIIVVPEHVLRLAWRRL